MTRRQVVRAFVEMLRIGKKVRDVIMVCLHCQFRNVI